MTLDEAKTIFEWHNGPDRYRVGPPHPEKVKALVTEAVTTMNRDLTLRARNIIFHYTKEEPGVRFKGVVFDGYK